MRSTQRHQLAQIVRQHREELERVVIKLEGGGKPLTASEARAILDSAARLDMVEASLRHVTLASKLAERFPRIHLQRFKRIIARVRSWTKPRIGRLRHYSPKRLKVPAKYLRAEAPKHAPTIAIVTPSFGQGRFLARTLHSVVSQNYPALEYVVQDGGSTDDTLEVLQRFGKLLTAWASEPDGGQADAINQAFRRTTGEIMGWLNSDDLLLPGSLAYVANYFRAHPSVDVVYGHRIMIDTDDLQIGSWILPKHDDLALTLADYIPQESLFWRRRLWERVGGRVDPSFEYALDWDLLLRFREAGAKMVRLPRFLAAFRVHDEQKTSAAEDLGMTECARLREREHGRPVPIDEVLERLRPYLFRHIVIHTRHRFVDRLPLRRIHVQTIPPEPSLGDLGVREEVAGRSPTYPSAAISSASPQFDQARAAFTRPRLDEGSTPPGDDPRARRQAPPAGSEPQPQGK